MFMREVVIVGAGMTKFGRHDDKTLMELLIESSTKALENAELYGENVDCVYVSSAFSGELTHQSAIASALTDQLGLLPAGAERIENGPASGGSAVKNAFFSIAAGIYDKVLVTGGEKMRHSPIGVITELISTMTHPTAEYPHGVTLPSLGAMFARAYMSKYDVTFEHLAKIAVKNHSNALKNPYAHIRSKISLEDILYTKDIEKNNPIIAAPLRLYDMCPISDGAASLILCAKEKLNEFSNLPIRISGVGHATDTLAVQERSDLTILGAVKKSSKLAFKMAGMDPNDIDVIELHDAFTILEIAESEDAGFFDKGTAHKAVDQGLTEINGELPINPSGGLKARGHPIGATGIAQLVELTWQLQDEAGLRQVKDAKRAFSCNFGGFGNNVVCFVLERM